MISFGKDGLQPLTVQRRMTWVGVEAGVKLDSKQGARRGH